MDTRTGRKGYIAQRINNGRSDQSERSFIGGDALNEATIITRMGHSVRLVSSIGNDAAAQVIISHCKANHISTDYLKLDDSKTTAINVGLIWEDGERTFINNKSGSLWTFSPEDIDIDSLNDGKILSFASIFNSPNHDDMCRHGSSEERRDA